MQVIYCWAFAVAPALCPFLPQLKNGGACPPLLDIWFRHLWRGPIFTKLGEDIRRSLQHCTFVSEFGYLAAFSIAGGSKLSDVETTPNLALLLPVKSRGKVGEISIPNVEAYIYDRTSGIHLMVIHCVTAKHGGLIKK